MAARCRRSGRATSFWRRPRYPRRCPITLSLSVPPTAAWRSAGDTASYQVQLTPHTALLQQYLAGSAPACPRGPRATSRRSRSRCRGPGSSTLNMMTTARPVVTPAASLLTRHFYALWLAVPGLTLLGVGVGSDRRRRRILGMLMVCALFRPAAAAAGVQYHEPRRPRSAERLPGIYTITVTATSGSDTKSRTITLAVP